MVYPTKMCTKYIVAEHHEIHMFAADLGRKQSVTGYIENDLLEPKSIKKRHDALVAEMERRGFHHNTPLEQPDISYLPSNERNHRIDVASAEAELFRRCELCPTPEKPFKDCQKCWEYKPGVFHGNCKNT